MLENLKSFFKLIRWFHELLAILPFLGLYLVIDYYTQKSGLVCNLSGFNFIILCFCVQLLIAVGCVLNDIMDYEIDKINKPKTHIIGNKISLTNAKVIFATLTLIIFFLSVYISRNMFVEWAFISTGVYILSIVYDVYFKQLPLFGNILMAILASFIPLVILFYAKDCIETLHNEKINILIYLYAFFPFLIIIPRELSLDISDIEGDKACRCKTLPILIGIKKSRIVVVAFLFLTIILSFFTALKYNYLTVPFCIIDVLILYYIYNLKKTETRLDYIKMGRFLWFIMIFGLVIFTVSTIIF